jgi:hypothetical protein
MKRLPGFVAETSLKPSGPAYRGAAGRAHLGGNGCARATARSHARPIPAWSRAGWSSSGAMPRRM